MQEGIKNNGREKKKEEKRKGREPDAGKNGKQEKQKIKRRRGKKEATMENYQKKTMN